MMIRRMARVAASTAAVCCMAGAQAGSWSLSGDWNPPDNPNGPWAYLSGSTPMPFVGEVGALGFPNSAFAPSAGGNAFLPAIFSRPDRSEIGVHSFDDGNGALATGEAVIRWTSPEAGMLDISGFLYWDHGDLQRSNDYTLRLVGSGLAGGVLSWTQHNGFDNRVLLAFTDLLVNVGDTLTLTIARSAGEGSGTFSYADLNLTVTAVPEPGAAALLALGLAGLAIGVRRRSSTDR